MPTAKPAKAPEIAANTKRISLVPAVAQQKMYKALTGLKPVKPGDSTSGAEVAEIAVCLAIGEDDPVILAYPAWGARTVRKDVRMVNTKLMGTQGGRLAGATSLAVAALLADSKATALVCSGKLDAREDYRLTFSFAARHKLPIMFLVANTLTPGRSQKLDLSKLYAEVGMPVFSVDASDAIAVYRVATEALHNARHLRGPCVIEALTVQCKGSISALELLRGYMEREGNGLPGTPANRRAR